MPYSVVQGGTRWYRMQDAQYGLSFPVVEESELITGKYFITG